MSRGWLFSLIVSGSSYVFKMAGPKQTIRPGPTSATYQDFTQVILAEKEVKFFEG